ncbi:hypothetical protein BBP40_007732 [Aspergillus hancockii]|nr:hypothetical protein BBP40_007732 [Aspergillus hancockii]
MVIIYFTYVLLFFFGAAARLDHIVHGKRTAAGWQRAFDMVPQLVISMEIALTQRNLEFAERYLLSISDPSSPQYSKYWTAEAVATTFAPSETTTNEVMSWLNESGITHTRVQRSRSGGELHFNVTVQEAEQLLRTSFHVYVHQSSKRTQVGCEEYSIPASIKGYIEFVTPTVHFYHGLQSRSVPVPKPKMPLGKSPGHYIKLEDNSLSRFGSPTGSAVGQVEATKESSVSLPSGCDKLINPDCLRALYHIPVSTTSHPDNSLGIVEFTWVGYLESDLDMFFELLQPSMVGRRPKFESIDGGFIQTLVQTWAFNGEADLDLEYAMALTHPLNVTNYQVGDLYAMGNMNNFLAAVDSTYGSAIDPDHDPIYPDPVPANPPLPSGYNTSDCGTLKPSKVVSVSYTHDEADFSPAYERRQCLEYLKLGLQGVTVIFASGDYGTAGINKTCTYATAGNNHTSNSQPNYVPTFPSTCPYITSVGGSQVAANGSVLDVEVALDTIITSANGKVSSLLSSAGGFSNIFAVPGYQYSAVQNYRRHLNRNMTGLGVGRGFPDVAANAAAHVTAVNGKFLKVYGTSASAPVFASIIAMINDARLNAGKQTVGFVNPVLYANPHVLNDVVNGTNYDCTEQPAYRASPGWDPVTGLGTPDFGRMLELFMRLP